MSEPTLKLPRNAEELLQEFPATEPDFEAQASAIVARLKGSPGGVVFDDLLRAPELATEPGEPAPPSSARAASAPKTHFAEMARKSLQQKDDAKELARELLAATAQSRRPSSEMVERVRAAGRAPTPATATPQPTLDSAAEEAQRASGVIARAATSVKPAALPANNRGVIVGIAGGLLALAACVALFLRSSGEDERTRAALAAQRAADAPAAAAPRVEAAPGAKANDGVVSPEALAAVPQAVVETGKPSALKAAEAPAPAAKSARPGAKPEAIALEEEPAPVQAAPVQAAPVEHQVEPAPEPQLRPAEGNASSVPLNPSGGAVSTALNSVRSDAQACLAGQTDAVSAVVTFASDGHVLRVSASGSSAACIRAALSRARIAPFAKESFSATTTIRPP